MKKNLVVTLLTVAMTATLVACGATNTNKVEANSTEMTTEYGTENGIATLDETEEVESVEMTTEYEEMNEVTVEIITETGYAVRVSEDGNTVIVDMDGNEVVYEEVVGYTVNYDEAGNFVLVGREGTVYELDNYDELVTKAVQDYVDGTTGASESTEVTESTEIVITEEKETSDEEGKVAENPFKDKTPVGGISYDDIEKGMNNTDGGGTSSGRLEGGMGVDESLDDSDRGSYTSDTLPDDYLSGGYAGDTVTVDDVEYTYDDQGILNDGDDTSISEVEYESVIDSKPDSWEDDWEDYVNDQDME